MLRAAALSLLLAAAAASPSAAQTLAALGLDAEALPAASPELVAPGVPSPTASPEDGPPPAAPPAIRLWRVEAGLRSERATAALPRGGGIAVALLAKDRMGGVWRADLDHASRFGESGVVGGLGYSRAFGRLRTATFVGSSTAGAYHARLRTAAALGVALGAREQLVLTGTAAYVDARDVHRDVVGTLELAAYPSAGLVAQAGLQVARSEPGSAIGVAALGALVVGAPEARNVSARARFGREAYLLVAPADGAFPDTDVSFLSGDANVTWREPLGDALGVRLGGGLYINPYYTRTTLEAGLSWTVR